MPHSIFDLLFNGVGRIDMYRHWVAPEYAPDEKDALIQHWHPEDREMYCGGDYTVR